MRKIDDFELFKELYNAGISYKEIAEVFDCEPQAVPYWRRKLNLLMRGRIEKINDDALFTEMWNSGKSNAEIAAAFDCNNTETVRWNRKRLKLASRVRASKVDKALFIEMWNNGIPAKEIAQKFNISPIYVGTKRIYLHLAPRATFNPQLLNTTLDILMHIDRQGGYMKIAELYSLASKGLVRRMIMKGDLFTIDCDLGRGSGGYKRNMYGKIFRKGFFPYKFVCSSRTNFVRLLTTALKPPKTRGLQSMLKQYLKRHHATDAEILAILWKLGCHKFSPSQVKSTIQIDGHPARMFTKHY